MKWIIPVTCVLLLYGCTSVEKIDHTDPEVMAAYDEVVLGIKESRFIDLYDILTDTIMITTDTMMLLLTVTKNDEKVYDEVRYEELCPG